jgi:hypothetical protein
MTGIERIRKGFDDYGIDGYCCLALTTAFGLPDLLRATVLSSSDAAARFSLPTHGTLRPQKRRSGVWGAYH